VRLPRGEGALKSVEAPAVLGELAFLDGEPRSATLQAVSDVEVARISPEAFRRLSDEQPTLALAILADLGRVLALRLRLATAVIADLRG
jgi:CRP/FNR family transcriptional regulator, cyclic AMP receptor protein